jgi:cytochrome P450
VIASAIPDAPTSDLDLFDDTVLADPYPAYATLRALGPAVYLTRHRVWAIPGYAQVRAALADPATFSSTHGVALTEETNEHLLAGTVLASDGADHARLRRVLSQQLAPRAIKNLATQIHQRADTLVADLFQQGGSFDAVGDLAQRLVADVVMDLMGLPDTVRGELIERAAATFEMFGPPNLRYQQAEPAAAAMMAFLTHTVTRETVRPDSWMGALYQAVDDGTLDEADVVPQMSAYATAGMDTTIHAISTAIALLATHPDQFANLRAHRVTAEAVFHETLRYDAPIQGFGRRVVRDTHIGNIDIPAGDQVWLLYGSTGRDRRQWGENADRFDPRRPGTGQHLALGHGPHLCAGNHLAALEATAVLAALASRCTRLTLDGEPVRALNNVLRGYAHLPIQAMPDRRRITRQTGER